MARAKSKSSFAMFATGGGSRTYRRSLALPVVVDVLSSQFLNKSNSDLQIQG